MVSAEQKCKFWIQKNVTAIGKPLTQTKLCLMLLSSVTLRSLAPISIYCRRTLFSFPDFSPYSPYEPKSQTYHEERVLPYGPSRIHRIPHSFPWKSYSAKEIYAVVADVASYPKFVPFCTGSTIDKSALARAMHEKTVLDAELTVGFMNFSESYVSTVTCIPYTSVQVWILAFHITLFYIW